MQQAVVELPVAVGTKPDKVTEIVHDGDGCIEWERRERTTVCNFDVLVVPTTHASFRHRGEVLPPRVLPESCEPTSRVIRLVGNVANRT